MKKKKIYLIAGARPNFIKIAPLYKRMQKRSDFEPVFIHTGQHYDHNMSGSFLRQLGLPDPDYNLEAGSGNHGKQTAEIMIRFEDVVLKGRPDLVLVVGDVNSTIACALVAGKLHIPVAHVEAGLRSFDRNMPEEINRVLTDQLSDYLFTTGENDRKNLLLEGISNDKIHFVGNIMVESLIASQPMIDQSSILSKYKLKEKDYVLLTLHRPSNVDDNLILKDLLDTIEKVSQKIPVVFPVHPRTRKRIQKFGMGDISRNSRVHILDPVSYFDFISLQKHAKVVLTDSGGVQTETTFLQVPCLTLRDNTEWTVTLIEGTNRLIGTEPDTIIRETHNAVMNDMKAPPIPKYWDDQVSVRILEILEGV